MDTGSNLCLHSARRWRAERKLQMLPLKIHLHVCFCSLQPISTDALTLKNKVTENFHFWKMKMRKIHLVVLIVLSMKLLLLSFLNCTCYLLIYQIRSVAQSCPNFVTPWIAARQASLSITDSRSSLRLNVYRVSDAIQPSHPLSSPSPPAPNPFQHQSLFQWVSSSHQVAKVLEFQL